MYAIIRSGIFEENYHRQYLYVLCDTKVGDTITNYRIVEIKEL